MAQNNNQKEFFRVYIRNREGILLQEEIKTLSSSNEKGPFDILGEHENFISIIKDFLVVRKKDGTKQEIKIDSGVIKVYTNEVWVYIGILSHLTAQAETTTRKKH